MFPFTRAQTRTFKPKNNVQMLIKVNTSSSYQVHVQREKTAHEHKIIEEFTLP